jgi:hypothetical protein
MAGGENGVTTYIYVTAKNKYYKYYICITWVLFLHYIKGKEEITKVAS